MNTNVAFSARTKAGRCANGAERDHGKVSHAVPVNSWKAICGTEPGRTSAGWSSFASPAITCPRCRRKLGFDQ
jgi:hypothetical protein